MFYWQQFKDAVDEIIEDVVNCPPPKEKTLPLFIHPKEKIAKASLKKYRFLTQIPRINKGVDSIE